MSTILDQLSANKKTAALKIQQSTLVDVNDNIKPFPWCLEYYIWYDVDVFGISRCMASRYVKGSWNRYVSRTLTEFVNSIEDMTTQARISKAYTKH